MADGLSISPEVILAPEHPLEGVILIHGFMGNIDKDESLTVSQAIVHGSLTSPSKRQLNEKEERRYEHTAPFDKNRIAFHTWKPGGKNSGVYIGQAAWAAPITVLEGAIVGDDVAMEKGDVFAYGNNGVEIPIQKGLIFISDDLIDQDTIQNAIAERANQENKTANDWIAQNIVLVPKETFNSTDELLKIIARRIQPSRNVSANFISSDRIGQEVRIDFTSELQEKYEAAKATELGDGSKIEGEFVSPEMLIKWTGDTDYFTSQFEGIEADMMNNPLRLEELRTEESVYDLGSGFSQLKRRVQTYLPNSELQNRIEELDRKREELIARNERILEDKYVDMPEYDVEPNSPDVMVYREKSTGKIRVHTPI